MARLSEAGGYHPSQNLPTSSQRYTWINRYTPLDVSVMAPDVPGKYPLIVYLPGLGENAEAGSLWREAWSKAGYVVFTMQPVSVANALPSGDHPQAADLRGIGREYFSQSALEMRLAHLAWALQEFQRRIQASQSPYIRADMARLAVAGYDLGAQTAAALAGEATGGKPADPRGGAYHAAIVLSPSVDLAAGNPRNHFVGIAKPLLAVTGTEDNDPYGISSPSLRPAIWRYAPNGDKYLLMLQNGTHGLLNGELPGQGHDGSDRDAEEEGHIDADTGFSPRDRGGPQLQPNNFGGGWGRRSRGGGGGRGLSRAPGGRRSVAHELVAVRDISTAFLDATLKADSAARQWLIHEANRWLGHFGKLQAK